MSRRRITLRLTPELKEYLNNKQKAVGAPKSKILIDWIDTFCTSQVNFVESKEVDSLKYEYRSTQRASETYNFSIKEELFNQLFSYSLDKDIELSEIIKALIFADKCNSIKTQKSIDSSEYLEKLWKKGLLSEIRKEYKKIPITQRDSKATFIYSKANVEIGAISEAERCLQEDIIALDLEEEYQYRLIISDIMIYRSEFRDAKKLLEENLNTSTQDKGLVAKTYSQLAEVYFLKGQYSKARTLCLNGLTLIGKGKYPIESAELISLLSELVNSIDSEVNTLTLNEDVLKIAKEIGNVYYEGWFLNAKAIFLSREFRNQEALETIDKAIECHNISGSVLKKYYAYGIKAKQLMILGDQKAAMSVIKKTEKLQQQLEFNSPFSAFKYLKLFCSSSFEFKRSIEKFQQNLRIDGATEYKRYLLAAAKYINGEEQTVVEQGRRGLSRLKSKTKRRVLIRSINQTLAEKKLYTGI